MRFRVKNKPTQVPEIEAELLVSDDGDLELWLNDILILEIHRSGTLRRSLVSIWQQRQWLGGIKFEKGRVALGYEPEEDGVE